MIRLFLTVVLMLGVMRPAVALADIQNSPRAALADFTAVLANQAIHVQWQATGSSVDWNFALYRSQNCQFEGAVEVTAPIFSSINDESNVANYSANDTAEPVLATCAYWLVATESNGQQQQFGPYEVQGRQAVYLPIALQ
ncbi:MAG: hypothetical protein DYG89_51780 [Caldilinea sp. CFX5]|nr:hypothetical protein [Caldilinea sp. CFX5]